ncbi:hypothetical protein ERJ75_001704900 [Trypanosoma vivax]|nr:hypothetical protein ERJ75_001704900 [Trypanosoma vivax]
MLRACRHSLQTRGTARQSPACCETRGQDSDGREERGAAVNQARAGRRSGHGAVPLRAHGHRPCQREPGPECFCRAKEEHQAQRRRQHSDAGGERATRLAGEGAAAICTRLGRGPRHAADTRGKALRAHGQRRAPRPEDSDVHSQRVEQSLPRTLAHLRCCASALGGCLRKLG